MRHHGDLAEIARGPVIKGLLAEDREVVEEIGFPENRWSFRLEAAVACMRRRRRPRNKAQLFCYQARPEKMMRITDESNVVAYTSAFDLSLGFREILQRGAR